MSGRYVIEELKEVQLADDNGKLTKRKFPVRLDSGNGPVGTFKDTSKAQSWIRNNPEAVNGKEVRIVRICMEPKHLGAKLTVQGL